MDVNGKLVTSSSKVTKVIAKVKSLIDKEKTGGAWMIMVAYG
jgi:hypothetical protein